MGVGIGYAKDLRAGAHKIPGEARARSEGSLVAHDRGDHFGSISIDDNITIKKYFKQYNHVKHSDI
jgi:hypothetical protein